MHETPKPAMPARIAEKLAALPALPSPAGALLAAAYGETPDLAGIVRVVEDDAELAARVLRYMNIRHGSLPEVDNVREAVDERGWEAVTGVALAFIVREALSRGVFDRGRYWRHAMAVGAAARFIAHRTGYRRAEEAFAAGILHDIGRAALALTAPVEYAAASEAVSAAHALAVDAERDCLGIDHAGVGERVLRMWGLPADMCGAVGLHHSDGIAALKDKPTATLAAVLQAADFLAWANGFGGRETAPKLAATSVIERALKGLDNQRVLDEMATELHRATEAFGAAMPDGAETRRALFAATVQSARVHNIRNDFERRLAGKIREVEAANALRMLVRHGSESGEVRRALLDAVCGGLGLERAALFDVDAATGELRGAAAVSANASPVDVASVTVPRPEQGSAVAALLESGKAAVISAADCPNGILSALSSTEAAVAPLTAGKRLVGVLVADNFVTKRPVSAADAASAGVLADEAALALANLTLYEQAQRMKAMAETDSLTGLHNRRLLLLLLQNEVDRAKRYSQPLSLVNIDLEGFKPFNDRYGHQVGDAVLKSFGRLLRKSCRAIDIPGRLGGDEFLVILPETGLEASGVYVERLRKLLDELNARLHERYADCTLTMSVGLTSFNITSDDVDSFLHRSDQAMYAAKQRGRNRVCAL